MGKATAAYYDLVNILAALREAQDAMRRGDIRQVGTSLCTAETAAWEHHESYRNLIIDIDPETRSSMIDTPKRITRTVDAWNGRRVELQTDIHRLQIEIGQPIVAEAVVAIDGEVA